jgi:Flp pilus assembly pilin Flp
MFSFSLKSKHGKGQGLVEYAVILGLVAIVAIASIKALVPGTSNVIGQAANSLSAAGNGVEEAVVSTEESQCATLLAKKNAQFASTVEGPQHAWLAAGKPSSGPLFDRQNAAWSTFTHSHEYQVYNQHCI